MPSRGPSIRRLRELTAMARAEGLSAITVGDIRLEIGDLPERPIAEPTAHEDAKAATEFSKQNIADYLCLDAEDIELPE